MTEVARTVPSHPGLHTVVNIHCSPSEHFASVIESLGGSILMTAPHSGSLIVLATMRGRLSVSFHTFERAMGVAIGADTLAVCTRTEVWLLRSAPDIAPRIEPRGEYDACYLARACHFTGDIQGHEAVWLNGELVLVNTLFSCLCTPHERYHFAPRWRPTFVTQLAPEDRCHLNGLAVADGVPKYVTVVAESDTRQGWRSLKGTGGCLIDVITGQTVVRGLCMPHSPRIFAGKVYLLDSGTGRLVVADLNSERVETVAELPGFGRGLAIQGSLAFVGLSRIRRTSDMTGLPIAVHPEKLKCGLAVVDLTTGGMIANLHFDTPVDELFDVQILSGVRNPYLSGPFADRGLGPPLWAIPRTK